MVDDILFDDKGSITTNSFIISVLYNGLPYWLCDVGKIPETLRGKQEKMYILLGFRTRVVVSVAHRYSVVAPLGR